MDFITHPENYAFLIPALPGLAFFVIVIGLCINRPLFMRLGSYISIWAIGFSAIISTFLFINMITGRYAETNNYLRPWAFEYQFIGDLSIQFGIAIDGISTFTVFMVSVVACLIQIYSTGYMKGDPHYGRYFAFHSLFVFSMLTMVLSDNLLSFLIGWEIMGLCSYLLIGFFYYKKSAADAQKKAFIVTKLGDIGMFLGILVLGGLVLKAGVIQRPPSPADAPPGYKPEPIVERYSLGNISFQFTDPQYEEIRAIKAEIEELESELEYEHMSDTEKAEKEADIAKIQEHHFSALKDHMRGTEQIANAFSMFNETLEVSEAVRKNILMRFTGREAFIDTYLPYIINILSDPQRPKGAYVGTEAWRDYCESLKTNDRYILSVQQWRTFNVGGGEAGTFKRWSDFCEKLKDLKAYPLTPDGFTEITKGLDGLEQEQKQRLDTEIPGVQKPFNPILVQILSDNKKVLEGLKPKLISGKDLGKRRREFDNYVRRMGFISAEDIKYINEWFQGISDEQSSLNPAYAASLGKFGSDLLKYINPSTNQVLMGLNDFRRLGRAAEYEMSKYLTRPVTIRELIEEYDWGKWQWLLTVAALLLFCGAIGKSAQVPLHVWLPDAMEGPTPVSALIHAATMVAAGVYMVGRFYFLFDAAPGALTVVAYIGAITAFGAATIGLVKNDIKRVLAYSTISQLGYMMVGLGVGSLTAGLFHLLAHAYFKALLFLGSGSVIHGSGTQDMREMGGLKKWMPWTYWTFLAGTLALCGVFPFAGFWSKDEVLGAAFNWALHGNKINFIVFILVVVGAFLTAFYMFRLISLTFYGKYRGEQHVHESPPSMIIPLVILAIFATLYGFIGMPFVAKINIIGKFVSFGHGHHGFSALTAILMLFSLGVAVAGVMAGLRLTYWGSPWKERMKQRFAGYYKAVCHMYYFDEFYNGYIVVGVLFLCKVMRVIDTWIIDGIVNAAAWATVKLSLIKDRFDLFVVDGAVNLVAWIVDGMSRLIRPLQSGYVQNAMLVVVIFVCVYLAHFFIKVMYVTNP